MQYHLRKCATAALAAVFMMAAGAAQAESSLDEAPDNKASDIHGAPGNTPGFGGESANPNGRGKGKNGGSGIHSIEDAPGQGDKNEDDNPPSAAGDMHGGLGANTGYPKDD
jgi:hypothetical protein